MRKNLVASATVLVFAISAGMAKANPYDRAVTREQCDQIYKTSGGTILGGFFWGGILGGLAKTSVNYDRYETCRDRFTRVQNGALTVRSPDRTFGSGQNVVPSSAGCPANFSGMYRGTLYCVDGRLR